MSLGDDGAGTGLGARLAVGLLALAALGVLLAYADRVFLPLPLYGGDEGAYLIHALYGKQLAASPDLVPYLQSVNSTAYFLIIRAVTYGTQNLLEWLRILGALAYFCGLALVFLSVRARLARGPALGFLLLALAFPYYRFIVTAMPEGWYVGLLGLIVLVTAWLYVSRPVVHALLAGTLCGVLVLLKPHGLSVAAAFAVLALLDLVLGRREPLVFLGRIAVFAAAFLASGNLLQLLAGQPIVAPFTFFYGAHYARALHSPDTPATLLIGLKSAVLMASATLVLAGVPIATGLARLAVRWRWSRGRGGFTLEPGEIVFLLVALAFAATLAMVAIFSMKAISYGPGEVDRLWGRYFEFFVPMIWLAAAPFIGEFERGGGRLWRVSMGVIPTLGLMGLIYFLFHGVVLFPWDATALTAFFRPDLTRYEIDPLIPYFVIAAAGTLAASTAMAFTNWRTHRIWVAYVVLLGVLSTSADLDWSRRLQAERAALDSELHVAALITARQQGDIAMVVDDPNVAHSSFLRLRARPHMILLGPDEDVAVARLVDYDTVIVAGAHDLVGGGWAPLFEGQRLSMFRRDPTLASAR